MPRRPTPDPASEFLPTVSSMNIPGAYPGLNIPGGMSNNYNVSAAPANAPRPRGRGYGTGNVTPAPAGTFLDPLTSAPFLDLYKEARGSIPTQLQSLQDMIQGGMNSPLLQAVLAPALQRLQAPQQQQQQQFTEAARAAGGLRGSTYGQGMNTLMQTQGQQVNDLMGQVIQQMLSTLVGGQLQEQRNAFLPSQAFTNLLGAIRPEAARVMPGQGGGMGGGGAAGGSDPFGGFLGTPPAIPGAGTPAVGNPFAGGGSAPQPVAPGTGGNAPMTNAPTPQYIDPWSGLMGGGGGGGGGFNMGDFAGGGVSTGDLSGFYQDPSSGMWTQQPTFTASTSPYGQFLNYGDWQDVPSYEGWY